MAKKPEVVWYILVMNNTIVFCGTSELYMNAAQCQTFQDLTAKGKSVTFTQVYREKGKTKKAVLNAFLQTYTWFQVAQHLADELMYGSSNGSIDKKVSK